MCERLCHPPLLVLRQQTSLWLVQMSHQRVKRLQVGGSAFNVVLSGTNGEEVRAAKLLV